MLWTRILKKSRFSQMDLFGFYEALQILSIELYNSKKDAKNMAYDNEGLDSLVQLIYYEICS